MAFAVIWAAAGTVLHYPPFCDCGLCSSLHASSLTANRLTKLICISLPPEIYYIPAAKAGLLNGLCMVLDWNPSAAEV